MRCCWFSARARVLSLVLLASCSIILLPSAAAARDAQWSIAPPGAWVQQYPLPAAPKTAPGAGSSGRAYVLLDHQVRVGPAAADYHRFAWRPVSTAGLQNASEIQIHFDPSFERLVIHHVRLLRDGADVFKLSAGDVRVIQQETDLDQQIYSGQLTAVVFLRGLRVGDTVDYAYTIVGTNPILGGGYDDELALAYDSPVQALRHVVQVPTNTPLYIKTQHTSLAPRVETKTGWQVYTWECQDIPAIVSDADEPGWYDPDPRIEVSTFESWGAVASWARSLFDSQLKPSPAIKKLADSFRKLPGAPAASLAAAAQFVQDEVRYLGVEMGPSSHQPHPPEQVLQQRFGDCKDKSLLLVALLRELGIDAAPALVDTEARHALDDRHPSPFAFDHAIVQVVFGGKTIWIDATESDKGGTPETWDSPDFERALVLRPGTSTLTPIPLRQLNEPTIDVIETYTLGKEGAPVRLEVTTTYRRGEADDMRQQLATTSPEELAKSFLDFYARDHADIKAIGTPLTSDNRERNVVMLTEVYELSSFWKDGKHQFRGWQVREELPKAAASTRKAPLAMRHPVRVAHHIVVRAASPFQLGTFGEHISDHAFDFTSSMDVSETEMKLAYEYQSKADSVPADRIKGHQQAIDRVSNALTFVLASDLTSPDAPLTFDPATWLPLGVGLLAAALLLFRVLAFRSSRRLAEADRMANPRPPIPRIPPGERAGSALVVATEEELLDQCSSRICRCGSTGGLTVVDRTMAAYDGRKLTVFRLRCGTCGTEQDVYAQINGG